MLYSRRGKEALKLHLGFCPSFFFFFFFFGFPHCFHLMSLWTAASLLWAFSCSIGLFYLLSNSPKINSLRKAFSVYLLCHVLQSLISLVDNPLAKTIQSAFICTSGCTYVVLGALLCAGGGKCPVPVQSLKEPEFVKRMVAFAVVLDIVGIALTASDLLPDGTVYAYVLGVAIATIFVLREIFSARLGSLNMRKALLLGTIFGIIDGGVPLFVTSSIVNFLSRVLDSLFYLPPVIWALRQYDDKEFTQKGPAFSAF